MDYLHNDIDLFINTINAASLYYNVQKEVIEKDYYVTMILHELANRVPYAVFKGGTSLSKCYKLISRFSEDIDITIDTLISQSEMKNLKSIIKDIATELNLLIPNYNQTRSRRRLNQYNIRYKSVISKDDYVLKPSVLLEVSFSEVSFPTVVLPVHSYVGDMVMAEAPFLLDRYRLLPFDMKLQSIERTFIDKVFAVCDYYLSNQPDNHSRHIYDIHKLLSMVNLDDKLCVLINEVRAVRAPNSICPSAKQGISISDLLNEIINKEYYLNDYNQLTLKILYENVPYHIAIEAVKIIADSGVFG